MISKTVEEKIQSYICGDLDIDESREIEDLINSSPLLREYLKDSKMAWEMLDSTTVLEPKKDYIPTFWKKVEEDDIKRNKGFLGNFNIKWVFASTLAVFLIITALTLNFFVFTDDSPQKDIVSYDENDQLLVDSLEAAITKKTAGSLDIYGPWEE